MASGLALYLKYLPHNATGHRDRVARSTSRGDAESSDYRLARAGCGRTTPRACARVVSRQTILDEKCEGTRTARLDPSAREITDVQRLNPILSASEGSKCSAGNS